MFRKGDFVQIEIHDVGMAGTIYGFEVEEACEISCRMGMVNRIVGHEDLGGKKVVITLERPLVNEPVAVPKDDPGPVKKFLDSVPHTIRENPPFAANVPADPPA
jgi:hypothetical protein